MNAPSAAIATTARTVGPTVSVKRALPAKISKPVAAPWRTAMAERARKLSSILEPGFASGYQQFKELVDFGEGPVLGLTSQQKVWLRLFELVSVAMIEGMNRAEAEQEIPPNEVIFELWSAVGSALGTVNAQAFLATGSIAVRREMLTALKHGYDKTIKGLTDGVPQ
jgi:hypothetical protein